jgi:hypothetical protein
MKLKCMIVDDCNLGNVVDYEELEYYMYSTHG